MGDPFSTNKSSKSTYEPFTGENLGRATDLYNQLNARFNDPNRNVYGGPNPLSNNTGKQELYDATQAVRNNMSNPTMQAYASGQFIDPMSNPYMQSYLDQATTKFSQMLGKAQDQTNATLQARGLPNGSQRQTLLAGQQKLVGDQVNNFLTNTGMQGYNQGVNNFMQANQNLNTMASQLAQLGINANNLDANQIAQAYQMWQGQKALDQQDTSNLMSWLAQMKNPTQTQEMEESGGWGPSLLGFGLGNLATGGSFFMPKIKN